MYGKKASTRHRAVAMTAAAIALVGGTAFGAANTANAATGHAVPAHTTPVGTGHVMFRAPAPILRSGIKGVHTDTAASCGMINIGSAGNYGYAGQYAGQVEQMLDTCDSPSTVWAHFEWSGSFQTGPYAGARLGLAVGSPYASSDGYAHTYWGNDIATTANKDVYFGGYNHGLPSPDAWRAGAEVNDDSCDQWGTLHWYGGADWDGPQGGCYGHDQVAPAIGQG